ncbi:MAG TPA: bifunctional glycosyltransferase family 2/GtrA family protein [Bryobacteraceae bacterium]|nr:bifunctional glycosyltransferase family 2/GtrA family protein [Bryobacteraceae bacterium]
MIKRPKAEPVLTRAERPNTCLGEVAVLIPAYNPDHTLVNFVASLSSLGFPHIVVINDGSSAGSNPVFEAISRTEGVRIVEHAANLGKGAALKTGINYALTEFRGVVGIVTADADGQHLPEDVVRVAARLLENPTALVLGARSFDGKVPWRSRIGNTITRKVVQLLVGAKYSDTQTGLRAIPSAFASLLPKLPSSGYDFELDMLVAARKDSIEVLEEPIQTIYETDNPSSHFNPLTDSMKIYFVLLRFSSVSLISALVDNLIFYVTYHQGATILSAQMLSRSTAALFNYMVVRRAVFHVRERHTSAFPKYLALTAISGAVSYACIRMVTDTFHIPVFRTKIAVETLLFFANFAVQRDWVFLRSGNAAVVEQPSEPWSFKKTDLLWLLLMIPAGIEIYGFTHVPLDGQIWGAAGNHRFHKYIEFFAALTFLFGIFARRYFLPVLVAAVVLCSAFAVGIVPVASVLLFVFSATILGRLCFGDSTEGWLAFLGGAALWIAGMYLTLHLPIHYPAVHLAALAIPILAGYQGVTRKLLEQWFEQGLALFRKAATPQDLPDFAAGAALAFVLIANWLIVLKPEVSTDGLAMHLAIPFNISLHHAFTVDFHRFIWALMPMGTDLLYSVIYPMGGEYAARLMNFAMLTGTACLLVQTARSFVSRPVALLLATLFVSSPLVYLVTGSLFVENTVALMVLGAVAALWRFHETQTTRYLMLAAVLFGASMTLKLGAVPAGLLGLIALLFAGLPKITNGGANKRRYLPLAAAVAVLLLIGCIPYVSAWWQSGNPFFPYQTGPFKSSFVQDDIRDETYSIGKLPLSWRTPYDLTFYTHKYFEGQSGSFGFQYLLFLPLVVAGLVVARSFKGRSVILIGTGAALVVAVTQPNARYFYFTLPLLTLGAAAGLGWLRARQTEMFQAAMATAVAACFGNLLFLPVADYYHRDFYSAPLFSAAGRQAYLHQTAPEREVISFVNRTHGNEPVILTDGSEIADVAAPVYALNWHDYTFGKQVRDLRNPLDVYRMFQQRGIEQFIVDTHHQNRWEAGVTNLLSACGQQEFQSGNYVAMKLRPDCEHDLLAKPTR